MKTIIVFPVFNEAENIHSYVSALIQELSDYSCEFLFVDDASTDNSFEILTTIANHAPNVILYRNMVNQGHGATLLEGLHHSLNHNPDYILSCDSDGIVHSSDFKSALLEMRSKNFQVLEGIRLTSSNDKIRNVVSAFSRYLVFFKSKSMPLDANTPFRGYTAKVLVDILSKIPSETVIPNIWVSIFVRKSRLNISFLHLHGGGALINAFGGSSWASNGLFASRIKFLKFAWLSLKQAWYF